MTDQRKKRNEWEERKLRSRMVIIDHGESRGKVCERKWSKLVAVNGGVRRIKRKERE